MGFLGDIKAFLLKHAALISITISLIIIIVPIIMRFFTKIKKSKEESRIEIFKAKIMSKRIFEPDSKNKTQERCYYFNFVLENGERIEFPVGFDIYESIAEGTDGTLVFKGGKCISFDFDK